MSEEPTAPAAGAAKATGFADRVRLGAQVQKAKQIRAEMAVRHQELLSFGETVEQTVRALATRYETGMADMDALIEGLEQEMRSSRPAG